MRTVGTICLVGTLVFAEARSQVNSSEGTTANDALQEVVVSGEQPGPGLWKITKGNHVLWILGTHAPLPQKMVWRSREVEAVIRNSQEVLGGRQFTSGLEGSASAELINKLTRNAKGKNLKDVLPDDLYRRFVSLRIKYARSGTNFEIYRPFTALQQLYDDAVVLSELSSNAVVDKEVWRLAKKHGVEYRRIELKDDRPKDTAAEFVAIPRRDERACVSAWMDRFENDLRSAVKRANFWAKGDIANMFVTAAPNQPLQTTTCSKFFAMSPRVKSGVAHIEQLWDEELEKALDRNRSTLVLEPISTLFRRDGLLARFDARGYAIGEPADHETLLKLAAAAADIDSGIDGDAASFDDDPVDQNSEDSKLDEPPSERVADVDNSGLEQPKPKGEVLVTGEKPTVTVDDCVSFSLLYSGGGFRKYVWQALDNSNLVLWVLKTQQAYHVRLSTPLYNLTRRHKLDFMGDRLLCGSGSSMAGDRPPPPADEDGRGDTIGLGSDFGGGMYTRDAFGIQRKAAQAPVALEQVPVASIRLLDAVGIAELESQFKVDLSGK